MTPDQNAVEYIRSIYVSAKKKGYAASLSRWIDPDNRNNESSTILNAVLSDAIYQPGMKGSITDVLRTQYKAARDQLVPVVENSALKCALKTLNGQDIKVGWLLLNVQRPEIARNLHLAANSVNKLYKPETSKRVINTPYKTFVVEEPKEFLPKLAPEEAKYVTGESKEWRAPGQALDRYKRRMYILFISELNEKKYFSKKYFRYLMAPPSGVQTVDEFARSDKDGQAFATKVLSSCSKAIRNMMADLDDKTTVWRLPPAIIGGLGELGYNDAAMKWYWLGYAESQKSKLNKYFDIAGNAIIALGLAGGPVGRAVVGISDLVLTAIKASVSFLRALEQEQAAEATVFAPESEKLSKGSKTLSIALEEACAILAAIAPEAVGKITGSLRKGKRLGSSVIHPEVVAQNTRSVGQEQKAVALARSVGQEQKAVALARSVGQEQKAVALARSVGQEQKAVALARSVGQEQKAVALARSVGQEQKAVALARSIDMQDKVIENMNVQNAIKDSLLQSKLSRNRDAIRAIEETLREGGAEITQNRINRIVRDLRATASEEGRIKPQKLIGYLPEDVIDSGLRGKDFEKFFKESATKRYGKEIFDLNTLVKGENFPVVDFALGDKLTGPIISNASGLRGRLLEKIQALFGVEFKDGKILRASGDARKNFDNAINLLVLDGRLPKANSYEEFIQRAKLMVPTHSVDSLKVYIRMEVATSPLRSLLLSSITSGI